MQPRHLPYLWLTLTALFWSGNYVVGRAVHDTVPPVTLALARWLVALLVLLPFAWRLLWRDWPLLWAQRGRVLVLALLGISGFNTLVYSGLQTSSATNGVLLNSFIPILVLLFSLTLPRAAGQGPRVSLRQGLGMGVSLLGVTLIVSRADLQALLALRLHSGDLWLLAAVVCWAWYTLALRGMRGTIHPLALLLILVLIGSLALLPWLAWEWAQGLRPRWQAANLLAVAYLGVFPSVLAYWFYHRGVAAIGPARASLFIHLMPAFGTVLAIVWLGEMPRWYHGAGIAAILTGIGLASRQPPPEGPTVQRGSGT